MELYAALRLPKPGNLHASLGRLVLAKYLVKKDKAYAVSPSGRAAVAAGLGRTDWKKPAVTTQEYSGSFFGNALHSVVPPELCPGVWAGAIQRFLAEHAFETNVLLMTRFPAAREDEEADVLAELIPHIRRVVSESRLELHLASDRQLVDDIHGNVAAHMWACRFGIGLFEDRLGRGLNYNVLSEVGAMLMTGRRCALLKDRTAPSMPSDIGGKIYKPVDFANRHAVAAVVSSWCKDDLGLSV